MACHKLGAAEPEEAGRPSAGLILVGCGSATSMAASLLSARKVARNEPRAAAARLRRARGACVGWICLVLMVMRAPRTP